MKFNKIVHVESVVDNAWQFRYGEIINTYVLLTAVSKKNPELKYYKFSTRAFIHQASMFADIKSIDVKQTNTHFINPVYSVVVKYMGQSWKYNRETRQSARVTALMQRKLSDIDNFIEIQEDEANVLLLNALL